MGCQIHKKRGNRFGINPLNLLSLKKVKRIVLNRNNQIKKAISFVLFHVLTTNAKIVLNGTYLPTTINRFSITPKWHRGSPVSILLQTLILDS
jgi:hypothetical protein